MFIVNDRIQVPDDEFELTYTRSSGPGGQNVNKVNSRATLRWPAVASASLPVDIRERFLKRYASRLTSEGELLISSQRHRDQPRNVEDCFEKLREMLLAVAVPPTRRRATKPSRGSKERRLQDKRVKSQRKDQRKIPPGD